MNPFSVSKKVWIPLLLLLLFTPWSAQMDLVSSRFFYRDGHFVLHPFFNFLFDYGIYPAWGIVGLAIFVLILSFFFHRFKKWQPTALYLILTFGIGAGLIVHAILKDHWGRPRPKQTIEYGGQQPFRPYYQPNFFNQPEPSKSFPCGHCSMGFYFFAVAMIGLYHRQKKIYYLGMLLAWGLGVLLGLTRMAQGGHFLSDVIVSGVVMWLVSLGIYSLMFKKNHPEKLK